MPTCQEAFNKAKEVLTTSEVLTYGGQLFFMYFRMLRKCQLLLHQGHWTRHRLIMLNWKRRNLALFGVKKSVLVWRELYPPNQPQTSHNHPRSSNTLEYWLLLYYLPSWTSSSRANLCGITHSCVVGDETNHCCVIRKLHNVVAAEGWSA